MGRANIIAPVVFLIVLCAVLAVYLLYKSNVEVIKTSRHYPNKTLIYDDYSFNDERLVYLVCDKRSHSKCRIVQERFMACDKYRKCKIAQGSPRSCNVSLDVEGELREQSILVVAFGDDKAILLWEDDKSKLGNSTYVRTSVVHIDSCTQTKYQENGTFSTAQLKNAKKIIPYNYSFDLFFKNATRCDNKECLLIVGWQGNISKRPDEPVIHNNHGSGAKNVYSMYPIENESPGKGYVYLKSVDELSHLYINRYHAPEKYIKSFSGETKMSVVNESIGICSRVDLNSNITCWQYDADGKPKLNVTLSDVNNITHLQSIYTLPEGGFLLSFVDFGRCPEDECDPSLLSTYFILKIDAAGKQVGKIRFYGLEKDYKGIKNSYIYNLPKKGKYCALIVPLNGQNDKFEVIINCFPMKNFDA